MHMSDALITPVVGGTTLAASSGLMGYSIRTIKTETLEQRLPLMGVMGAFLFAAQMINFAIPGTGSSGHIGGGMLLAIILGPAAGFITMACVLLIQALFFADGGLLAFGCNLINLGFFTAYVAYPLVFKPLIARFKGRRGMLAASIAASIVGLQLGAFGVVVETWLSGRTDLPFTTFLLFMQPIHLAIGIIEGVVTGLIVYYIYTQNAQLIYSSKKTKDSRITIKALLIRLGIATLIVGGLFSLYASSQPDGLEWAVFKTFGDHTLVNESAIVGVFEGIQERLSPMPDYNIGGGSSQVGASLSGVIGSLLTLAMTVVVGYTIRRKNRVRKSHE